MSTSILNTPEGELALFRALIHHRPVGTDRHWALIGINIALKESLGTAKWQAMGDDELENKLKDMYDEEVLVAQTTENDDTAPRSSPSTPLYFTLSLPRDRSPSPTPYEDTVYGQAFLRGKRAEGEPTPPPPPEGTTANSSPSRGGGGSPRKRKRGEDAKVKEGADDESESDLSELDSESPEGEGDGEDADEGSPTASASGEEEEEEYTEKKDKEKEKAAQIRSLPSSKRQTRQRSRSVSATPQVSKKEEGKKKAPPRKGRSSNR